MIKQTNTVMEKAVNVIYDMSEDTRLKEAARLREKMMHDEVSALAFAERKGMEKGMEKGREEGIETGREEGIEIGMEKVINALCADGYTEQQIKNLLNTIEQ